MCFNSKKNFIKNFKQFENNLPDIKEEQIEFPLKKLIYIIKEKIEGTIKEGENKYNFDFSQEKSLPIKFNLTINYTMSIIFNFVVQYATRCVFKFCYRSFNDVFNTYFCSCFHFK